MKKLLSNLTVQVLCAMVAGVALGHFAPEWAVLMQPLGEAFIKLIKLVIGPIVFCTVVSGIAGMRDLRQAGRVGGKAFLYFEVVSTAALMIGLLAAHVLQPGAGFHVDPATLDTNAVTAFVQQAKSVNAADFLLHSLPDTLVSAFVSGNLLQVLVVAVLVGVALAALGQRGESLLAGIDKLAALLFGIVRLVMRAAPIGAFGAMACAMGRYGVGALLPQVKLIGAFYLSAALFILLILGAIARLVGFSLLRLLAYLKTELLIAFSANASEAALPGLIDKLEKLGCARSIVGLVVPAGYSCNLDGTNLYLTLAALFIAQATGTELTLTQELTLLAVAALTSKGASGVAGAGFVTLAATLTVVPTVPLSGLVLILGVDHLMGQGRALANIVGNGVAAVVVCAWEKQLDRQRMRRVLSAGHTRMPKAEPPAAPFCDVTPVQTEKAESV
jgi:aerobic C4-dicarboxylate transport protein